MHIGENNVHCFPPESMMSQLNKWASLDFLHIIIAVSSLLLPFNNFSTTRDRLCQESNQVKNNREIIFQKIIIDKRYRNSKILRSMKRYSCGLKLLLINTKWTQVNDKFHLGTKSGNICLLFRSYKICRKLKIIKMNPLPSNWSKLHSKLQYGRENRCFDRQSGCFGLSS